MYRATLGDFSPKIRCRPLSRSPLGFSFLLRRNPEREGKGEGMDERERGEPEAALGELEAVAPLDHQVAVRPAGEAA
jgi:hypothetical protein